MKLKSLGFVWNASSTSWDTHYQALVEYKKRYGNCNVPRPYPDNPKLSNWVYNHRSEYSRKRRELKNNLTREREEKLDAIGFAWVLKQKTNYNHLDERDDVVSFNHKRGIDCVEQDGERVEAAKASRKRKNTSGVLSRPGSALTPGIRASLTTATAAISSLSIPVPPKLLSRGAAVGNHSLLALKNFDEDQVFVASQLLNLKTSK
jgi:hypothetical protein